jgi:hypothetical protein
VRATFFGAVCCGADVVAGRLRDEGGALTVCEVGGGGGRCWEAGGVWEKRQLYEEQLVQSGHVPNNLEEGNIGEVKRKKRRRAEKNEGDSGRAGPQ